MVIGTSLRELQAAEAGVKPVLRDKVFVAALFHHAPVLHDDDLVGIAHGGEAVRDDKGSASGGELFERVLNGRFAGGVQG